MSTRKLTIKSETSTRASDETLVIAARSINDSIYPNNIIPVGSIYLANTKYLVLKNALGSSDAYITRDASDNLIAANLKASGEIQLVHTMSGGNQRYFLLKEYGATDTQAIQVPYDLHIVTENDNIYLRPANDVIIPAMPTTDPAVDGALWDDLGDVRISTGTATKNYCFAGIYVYGGSTAQSIPTGATYTKITAFTTNGASLNCTADAANDKVTITTTGYYRIESNISYITDTAGITVNFAAFSGGTEKQEIHIKSQIGAANFVENVTMSGIIDITSVPVDIDLRAIHNQVGAVNFTVNHSNLSVHKIAPT